MKKYWFIAIALSLVAAAGVILGVASADNKPAEFKLSLVYSGDTWGDVFPCG